MPINGKQRDELIGTGCAVRFDEPLCRHTTLGVGGNAAAWVEPEHLEQLSSLLKVLFAIKTPFSVIGAGSNILARNGGMDGVVISLRRNVFGTCWHRGGTYVAGAGCLLQKFIAQTISDGLAGVECLAGIPGTVGGAVVMNAGTGDKKDISSSVYSVTVMDSRGSLKTIPRPGIKFGYRRSGLEELIVLGAEFKLSRGDRERSLAAVRENMRWRKKNQETASRTAGCVFKNPPGGVSAGWLLEKCGMKGLRRGGAQISTKHANFIVNRGSASAGDIMTLIDIARQRVRKEFSMELELEIKIL